MKTSRLPAAFLLFALLLPAFSSVHAAEKPAPREIPADMFCSVCGMYPARFPLWQTEIIFSDGSMAVFDGSREMFEYLLNQEKYNQGKTRADAAAIWVKDHRSNKWIDGESAYYLVGSAVMGPMGKDLVPFADADEAAGLRAEKGGTVIPFSEVTREIIDKLGMKMGGM